MDNVFFSFVKANWDEIKELVNSIYEWLKAVIDSISAE